MIPDPKLLMEKTEIFTSDDLKGENRKYLPWWANATSAFRTTWTAIIG